MRVAHDSRFASRSRPARNFLRVVAAALPALAAITGVAVAAPADSDVFVFPGHDATGRTRCSGALLSSRVVLTSARCAARARGGRVEAPGGPAAAVAAIALLDWGRAVDHAQEHDLALLVLAQPMSAASWATLDRRSPCAGGVASVTFASTDGARSTAGTVTLARRSPAARPFALALGAVPPLAPPGSAVRLSDGALIGVYAGRGSVSGQGYAVRFDQASVMMWIEGIVAREGGRLQIRGDAAPAKALVGDDAPQERRGCASGGQFIVEDGSGDADRPIEDIDAEAADAAPALPSSGAAKGDRCGPAGARCSQSGALCGNDACVDAGFCNVFICSDGRWTGLEVPPPPPPPATSPPS